MRKIPRPRIPSVLFEVTTQCRSCEGNTTKKSKFHDEKSHFERARTQFSGDGISPCFPICWFRLCVWGVCALINIQIHNTFIFIYYIHEHNKLLRVRAKRNAHTQEAAMVVALAFAHLQSPVSVHKTGVYVGGGFTKLKYSIVYRLFWIGV